MLSRRKWENDSGLDLRGINLAAECAVIDEQRLGRVIRENAYETKAQKAIASHSANGAAANVETVGKGKINITCYTCGQWGHKSDNCPNVEKPRTTQTPIDGNHVSVSIVSPCHCFVTSSRFRPLLEIPPRSLHSLQLPMGVRARVRARELARTRRVRNTDYLTKPLLNSTRSTRPQV